MKGLLAAFAGAAPEKTILVVLRYLRPPERGGECVPDCFSLEGLIGLNTIKPPTSEALRKALSDAAFRS